MGKQRDIINLIAKQTFQSESDTRVYSRLRVERMVKEMGGEMRGRLGD